MMIIRRSNSILKCVRSAVLLVSGMAGTFFASVEVTAEPDAFIAPIEKVLRAEADGWLIDRREQLAGKDVKKSDEARWHSGEVWIDKKWIPFHEIDDDTQSALMKRYLKERGDKVLDVVGHRRMASWCEEHDLRVQADAHWFGVLTLSPNDVAARKKLQYKNVDGEWVTDEDLRDANNAAKEKMVHLRKWMPSMKRWAAAIVGTDAKSKLKAIEELKATKEIESVFAMGVTAAQLADDNAIPFIQGIRNFRSPEACETLTRIALVDPSSKFGQVAIEGMKEYPIEFYAPNLISQLVGGSELEFRIFKRDNGERVLRQIYREHLRDFEKLAVIDTVLDRRIASAEINRTNVNTNTTHYLRMKTSVTSKSTTAKNLLTGTIILRNENELVNDSLNADANREADRIASAQRKENDENKFRQSRIIRLLNLCAGTNEIVDAREWWRWWDLHNERVKAYGPTPYKTFYQEDRKQAYTISSKVHVGSMTETVSVTYQSCLVAGTPIQTDRGLKDIKTIRQGDLVLSQNIETGELAMKPVLKTTLRPPAKTLVFRTDVGQVQSTLGHFWWVAGRGWVRTKELETGMRIHHVSGTSTIQSIEEGQEVETYNLVVADNHSYFVGEERLLSYDATDLTPTLQTVPGLRASVLAINSSAIPQK